MKRQLRDRLLLKLGRRREGVAEGRLAVAGLLGLAILEWGLRFAGFVILLFALNSPS